MAEDTPRPLTVEQEDTLPISPNTVGGPGTNPGASGPIPGLPFGPYLVVERVGSGGMGEIFRAGYPVLGRDVALKVLRNDETGTRQEARRTRLLREARAMARLAHANVVTVYDAGEIDGQVYLAMELVEGSDLRAWLSADRRSIEAILQVFIAAGRGLAAAHEAGMVHRDFKPDNVIVGRDGRARVTDFGIAAAAADRAESGNAPASVSTITEGTSGTPAYMAPEQHLLQPVDARADQFAFCVSLWEALYGQRPFIGANIVQLRDNVNRGIFARTPPGARVPAWIRDVLVRGLRVAPEHRFPSMGALLDRLARDPRTRRRRIAAAAAVAIASGVAVFAVMRVTAGLHAVCAGGAARLAGVWDPTVASSVRSAFLASGRPHAADTYDRVGRVLDGYAGGWTAMRHEACEATSVRREQSSTLMDLRMACLDRHLAELRALTSLFAAAPDAELLDRAVPAVLRLDPQTECGDTEALLGAVPLPADPGVRARVASVRQRLTDVKALRLGGKPVRALPAATALVEEARASNHPPLVAETLQELAAVQSVARDTKGNQATAEQLMQAAARAKDDRRIAKAWLLLASDAADLGQGADTLEMRPRVEAAIARAGDDPSMRAELSAAVGRAQRAEGDHAAAERSLLAAIRIMEEDRSAPHEYEIASFENSLGVTLRHMGKLDEARAHLERAKALFTAVLGADHPNVAGSELNLATLSMELGRLAEARAGYLRALAIWEGTQGPDGPDIGLALNNLGELSLREGKVEEAQKHVERALSIKEKSWGAEDRRLVGTLNRLGEVYISLDRLDDAEKLLLRALAIGDKGAQPDAAEALLLLGMVARERGDMERALAYADRALPILDKALPPENPRRLAMLARHAVILESAGRFADALREYEAAWAVQQRVLPSDHGEIPFTLTGLGVCYLALRRPADALPLLERAVAFRDAHPARPRDRGRSRFALARALVANGKDRDQAATLAEQARTDFASAGEKDQIAALDRWRGTLTLSGPEAMPHRRQK